MTQRVPGTAEQYEEMRRLTDSMTEGQRVELMVLAMTTEFPNDIEGRLVIARDIAATYHDPQDAR